MQRNTRAGNALRLLRCRRVGLAKSADKRRRLERSGTVTRNSTFWNERLPLRCRQRTVLGGFRCEPPLGYSHPQAYGLWLRWNGRPQVWGRGRDECLGRWPVEGAKSGDKMIRTGCATQRRPPLDTAEGSVIHRAIRMVAMLTAMFLPIFTFAQDARLDSTCNESTTCKKAVKCELARTAEGVAGWQSRSATDGHIWNRKTSRSSSMFPRFGSCVWLGKRLEPKGSE